MFVLVGAVILSLAIPGCEDSKTTGGEGSLAYVAGANKTPEINISAKIKGNDIVVELKVVNHGVDSSNTGVRWSSARSLRQTSSKSSPAGDLPPHADWLKVMKSVQEGDTQFNIRLGTRLSDRSS